MLEVKKLTKKFKDFTAVDGVSFVVNKGEILGLIGEKRKYNVFCSIK